MKAKIVSEAFTLSGPTQTDYKNSEFYIVEEFRDELLKWMKDLLYHRGFDISEDREIKQIFSDYINFQIISKIAINLDNFGYKISGQKVFVDLVLIGTTKNDGSRTIHLKPVGYLYNRDGYSNVKLTSPYSQFGSISYHDTIDAIDVSFLDDKDIIEDKEVWRDLIVDVVEDIGDRISDMIPENDIAYVEGYLEKKMNILSDDVMITSRDWYNTWVDKKWEDNLIMQVNNIYKTKYKSMM